MISNNILADAMRLASWRAPRTADNVSSPLALLLIYLGVASATVLCEFLVAGAKPARFQLYGVNAVIAYTAVSAGLAVCFASVAKSPAMLRSLVLLQACGLLVELGASTLVNLLPDLLAPIAKSSGSNASIVQVIVVGVYLLPWLAVAVWFTGAARVIFSNAPQVRRPTLRAFALTGCTILVSFALPYWPVFAPRDFSPETANAWELASNYLRASRDGESKEDRQAHKAARQKILRLEAQQSVRVTAELNAVPPRDATKANIFMVGISGYGDQDVFARETEQSLDILKSRFGIGDRIVRLINDEASTSTHPIASVQNLGQVLRELGARMDADKDVLILTMTSHGSRDGFVLYLRNSFSRVLDPQTLKSMLDEAGIRNRVLIVSACYSGAFVPELADDNTMILTAASATTTSFGCAGGRKWTYFGDALFDHGFKEKGTLSEAFTTARETVGQWEKEQKLTPSDPQISVGQAIARRFPALVGPAPAHARRTSEEDHAFARSARADGAERIVAGSP